VLPACLDLRECRKQALDKGRINDMTWKKRKTVRIEMKDSQKLSLPLRNHIIVFE
jgi:hypothetical protein